MATTNNVLIQKYQGATSGYNQINPLTVDEDLNTRIGFASGSTSKDIIDYNSQFWWKRRKYSQIYNLVKTTNKSSDSQYSSSSRSYFQANYFCRLFTNVENYKVYYSESVNVNQDTGQIELQNPKYVTTQGKEDTYEDIFSELVGKYVQKIYDSTIERIVFIPVGEKITSSTYNNRKYFYAQNTTVVCTTKLSQTYGAWETIFSNDENSYPKYDLLSTSSDQYFYLGNCLKDWQHQCKIDSGTYIGTRTSEVTLKFEFQPKFVIIAVKTPASSEIGQDLFAIQGATELSQFYRPYGTGGSYYGEAAVYFEWIEKGFHATQVSGLNVNGTEYVYVAFG